VRDRAEQQERQQAVADEQNIHMGRFPETSFGGSIPLKNTAQANGL
jgi:hypothetical protein